MTIDDHDVPLMLAYTRIPSQGDVYRIMDGLIGHDMSDDRLRRRRVHPHWKEVWLSVEDKGYHRYHASGSIGNQHSRSCTALTYSSWQWPINGHLNVCTWFTSRSVLCRFKSRARASFMIEIYSRLDTSSFHLKGLVWGVSSILTSTIDIKHTPNN